MAADIGSTIEICPESKRHMRACLRCKLVKTEEQFIASGCENCGDEMRGDRDNVLQRTTPNFFGLVAMMDTQKSWVARWQRTDSFVPGCYALNIVGKKMNE